MDTEEKQARAISRAHECWQEIIDRVFGEEQSEPAEPTEINEVATEMLQQAIHGETEEAARILERGFEAAEIEGRQRRLEEYAAAAQSEWEWETECGEGEWFQTDSADSASECVEDECEDSITYLVQIRNLEAYVTEEMIEETFGQVGVVQWAHVVDGIGEVTFGSAEEAEKAVRGFDGVEFDGTPMAVAVVPGW